MRQTAIAASLGTAAVCCLTLFTAANLPSAAQTGTTTAKPAPPAPAKVQFFEAKVRPLLIAKCQPCHNETVQQGGVRLDTRELALKTLTPGKPGESRLISVIHYTGEVKMPPIGKLAPAEIALLEKWVTDGAVWPESVVRPAPLGPGKAVSGPNLFWSFRPVRRPLEPPIGATGIDAFIGAELQKNGLSLSPEADRTTLLRRLSYDLTGLPPTPADVTAFVNDKRPDAYARQVDRLLASPRFGERWARHWLDVARYADSNGLDENLAYGDAFRYRDWVIDSLNRDLPYDQFLRDQIAGDLLPTDDEDERNRRITATGFLTLGAKVLAEQDKPKLVMDIIDEQIDVVSKATMGLTVSCARCHDHKFDPISTKDYYALAGIFKSTKTMDNLGFVSRWNETALPTKAKEAEIARYEQETIKPLEAKLREVTEKTNAAVAARLRADAPKYATVALAYLRQPGVLIPMDGREVPGKQTVEAETFARGNALRNTETYGKGIGVIHTGDAPTSAEWDLTVASAGSYQLDLRYAAEESRPVRILVNGKEAFAQAAGEVTGSWNPEGQRWETIGAMTLTAGKNVLRIERDGPIPHIDKFAYAPVAALAPSAAKPKSVSDLARENGLNPGVLSRSVARAAGAANEAEARQRIENSDAFTKITKPETQYTKAEADAVEAAAMALNKARDTGPKIPMAMAVEEEPKPENVKVHIRGDTQNVGDLVPRGFPVVLCGGKDGRVPEDAGSGRLAMAKWLTSPNHPLTARVEVNRVWQHLFGEGIVRTPDNWGIRGEKPTHPELLDWLAYKFMHEDGWSVKTAIRRIVLSRTYRQASLAENPAARAKDPDNRLFWRQNIRRLEVEPIRDGILFVSGTLDLTMGGSLLKSKTGDYVTDDQSKERAIYNAPRRSIYLPVIRNAVFDLFSTFDFGDPTMVNAKRAATTVAPQALYLLNSPLVQEQALAFARSLLAMKQPDEPTIRAAIFRAYARPATAPEVSRAQSFLARAETVLAPHEPDTAKRKERACAAYCQTLLASNEFVYLR